MKDGNSDRQRSSCEKRRTSRKHNVLKGDSILSWVLHGGILYVDG